MWLAESATGRTELERTGGRARDCAPAPRLISLLVMIDTRRQLPFPSADGWSIDLSPLGGPRFVILASSEHQARERLAEQLAALGKADTPAAARDLIAEFPTERVAVIW